MNRFTVRVYEATGWSFLSQADHFEDHEFETTESIEQLARRLAREGFATEDGGWVMPGAILKIEPTK